MTYEEATQKANEMLVKAQGISRRYNPDGEVDWAFVAGVLKTEIAILLMDVH